MTDASIAPILAAPANRHRPRQEPDMGISSIISLTLIVVFVFYVIRIFNTLISLKNHFQNAFAQIEVQLKRRYDLIPNLVEATRAYLKHERETLESVIAARNEAASLLKAAAANPGDGAAMKKLGAGEGLLQQALGRLNVAVEAYPDLKANANIAQLKEELTHTENRVAFARQAFNDSVTQYNIYRQSFPHNLFAPTFGHAKDATLLEIEDRAEIQAAPKVTL
jgi:LemA protein